MSRLHFITDYGDIQFFAAFTMPCICAGIFVYHTTTAMFRLPNGVYIVQNMFTHNMYSAHSVAYLNIFKIFEIEVMFTRCRIFLFIRKRFTCTFLHLLQIWVVKNSRYAKEQNYGEWIFE